MEHDEGNREMGGAGGWGVEGGEQGGGEEEKTRHSS